MLKLNAVGLFVNNIETMVSFYRDVMGMKTDWTEGAYADLYSDNARLIMYGRKEFEEMTIRSYTYPSGLNGTLELSFDVVNYAAVDAEYARVIKAGATPVFPPTDEPWGQRTSFVADPDGNLIEIGSCAKE